MAPGASNNPRQPTLEEQIAFYCSQGSYPSDPKEQPKDSFYDLAAALAGVKPAALFSIPNTPGCVPIDDSVLAIIESHGCYYAEFESPVSNYRNFAVSRDRNSVESLAAIYNGKTKLAAGSPEAHGEIGRLLGYDERAIDEFCKRQRSPIGNFLSWFGFGN